MPHRKKSKHHHVPGHLHEFTFSCFQRRALLTNDDWRRRLSRHIDSAGEEERIDLVAFVFMPEHIHLLVYPQDPEPDLARYLALFKQPFSKEIKRILLEHWSPLLERLTVQERPGKFCFRFWQEGVGYDRNFFTAHGRKCDVPNEHSLLQRSRSFPREKYSREAILKAIEYLHLNPFRRGLYQRSIDWKWSFARYYYCDPPRQQDPDLPFIKGLPVGVLD